MVCEGNSIRSLGPLGSSGFVRQNGFYKDLELGTEPHRMISKYEQALRAPWMIQFLFVVGRIAYVGGVGRDGRPQVDPLPLIGEPPMSLPWWDRTT